MTAHRPYPEYRDVGVRWLRRLPAGWDVSRARYLCDVGTGSGDTIDAVPGGGYPFIVRSQRPLESDTYEFDCEAVLTAGDGGVGEIFHHVNGKFLAHQRVYVLTNFRTVQPRFFFYYFSALFGLMALDGSAKTTVDSVRRWMITDMPFAIPPPREQEAIAAYLDRETAEIDTLIAKQGQLITTLLERRAALRDQHFQRVAGKRETTVRRVLQPQNRAAAPGAGIVTAYRDGVVTLRSNRRQDGYTLSDTEGGYQEVLPGDLVFHALDAFAGAVGISDSHGNATPVYHVCRTIDGDNPEYVAMLLRYLGVSGFLATQAPNVRQRSVDFRNWRTFARIPLTLPPAEEQGHFVSAVNDQSSKIDALIEKAREFVAVSKERRAALITSAVTGQVDVRHDPEAMAAVA